MGFIIQDEMVNENDEENNAEDDMVLWQVAILYVKFIYIRCCWSQKGCQYVYVHPLAAYSTPVYDIQLQSGLCDSWVLETQDTCKFLCNISLKLSQ